MYHTAFSYLNNNKSIPGSISIHLYLKNKFKSNDYITNSAVRKAASLLTSQKELNKMYIKDTEDYIDAISEKIEQKQNYLNTLRNTKKSIIEHTKLDKPILNSIFYVKIHPDNTVIVNIKNHKVTYKNIYDFEHQYLDIQIHKVSSIIHSLKLKLKRHKRKLNQLNNKNRFSVYFGTKKLLHKEVEYMPEEQRKKIIKYKRYGRMEISGRKDAKQGNFSFRYNKLTNELTFLTADNKMIIIPKVKFNYKKKEFLDALNTKGMPIAWEIVDKGSAWQINCVFNVNDSLKNDYFGDGCIGLDINYDNLSITNIDRNGNYLYSEVIYFDINSTSSKENVRRISEALEKVFKKCKNTSKPLTIEKISNTDRKSYYDKNKKRMRKISLFASSRIKELILSKAEKYSIYIEQINPAYTSQTGKIKYMKKYGLSIHESASFVIARRGLGIIDKIPKEYRTSKKKNKSSIKSDKLNKSEWNKENRNKKRMSEWKKIYKKTKLITVKDIYNKAS